METTKLDMPQRDEQARTSANTVAIFIYAIAYACHAPGGQDCWAY